MASRLTLEEIKKKAVPILRRNDVVKAAVFGSTVRGDARPDSDIDFLIDFGENQKSLFDLAHLQNELEKELDCRVDLSFFDTISPRIRQHVLEEQIPVL
ncbi:MAG: nucleotidyltransferase family protein [Deltaproteobacteria bacterium]|nr:nucleotidyltransferase family protein [Deltaproteobacteria bacterium]